MKYHLRAYQIRTTRHVSKLEAFLTSLPYAVVITQSNLNKFARMHAHPMRHLIFNIPFIATRPPTTNLAMSVGPRPQNTSPARLPQTTARIRLRRPALLVEATTADCGEVSTFPLVERHLSLCWCRCRDVCWDMKVCFENILISYKF